MKYDEREAGTHGYWISEARMYEEKYHAYIDQMQGLPPFLIMPRTVLLNHELSPREKLLFGLIEGLTPRGCGYCRESDEGLAYLLGVKNKETVAKMLSKLEEMGYIMIGWEEMVDGHEIAHKNRLIQTKEEVPEQFREVGVGIYKELTRRR